MATADFAEPPTARNILRGHRSSVHATVFLRNNERLASGDSDGHVVLWDLAIMRPRAVWRAHEGAILGIRGWGRDKIITHGRDHKLIVWQLGADDESRLSQVLPVEDVPVPRPQPWLLHLLEVNTMNFCSFDACAVSDDTRGDAGTDDTDEVFVAVPNTLLSEAVDIYHLPTQKRLHTVKMGSGFGMAMSLAITWKSSQFVLVGAFENGHASVHVLGSSGSWVMTYQSQTHSQPILSMMLHPSKDCFFTSGADAIIGKHPVPLELQTVAVPYRQGPRVVEVREDESATQTVPATKVWDQPLKQINTKHAGQQGLQVRSDGRILATAGWDTKARVYSCKTLKELAVLEWHKVGCYSVAFSSLRGAGSPRQEESADGGVCTETASQPQSRAVAAIAKSRSAVKDWRLQQATSTHWLAAGAKDGKISLWDIY